MHDFCGKIAQSAYKAGKVADFFIKLQKPVEIPATDRQLFTPQGTLLREL